MKHLLLFRHGKSDWDADYQHDCDRPLAKRGIKAAKKMGLVLKQIAPDFAITSSAVRARTTLDLAMQAGQWSCPVEVTPRLYEADVSQAIYLIRQVTDSTQTLLLVGHEPTWSALVCHLIGGGNVQFPTAAIASIKFEIESWQQVQAGRGILCGLLQPKLLQ